jgi:predicted transglutaminase-like cysteine proteinase
MRIRRIVTGTLKCILPLAMAAMAGAPASSLAASSTAAFMPMGAAVPAPRGFIAFCERSPAECPQAPLMTTVPFLPGTAPFAKIEGRFYRADAGLTQRSEPFDVSAGRVQPASAPAAWGPRFGSQRAADWSGLFAAARLDHVAAESSPMTAQGPTVAASDWSKIVRVNKQVNKAIIFREDERTWGANDYWALPLEQGVRSGDCEDYVLEKRRALQAEGVPKEALSIALVITPWGESHAVLLVATQKGEMVLDNLSPWIVPWSQTGYRWLTRQAPGGDAMTWVSIASTGA